MQEPARAEVELHRTAALRYLLHVPQGTTPPEAGWPLLVFLHGAGERGEDLALVKRHVPPSFLDVRPDFPAIVVSPQCPAGEIHDAGAIVALIETILRDGILAIDRQRVLLTGVSMGGHATWEVAFAAPYLFAAILPICGWAGHLLVPRIVHLPVWAFHGDADTVVPLGFQQHLIDALQKHGAAPRWTVYPGVGHDSWTQTYENPEVWEWLWNQRK